MRERSKGSTRRGRFVWGAFAAALAVGVVSPPAQSAEGDVEILAELDLDLPPNVPAKCGWYGNVNIIMDPANRRGYQVMMTELGADLIGRVWDLDARRVILERNIDRPSEFPGRLILPQQCGAEWVHTLSPDGSTLFMAYMSPTASDFGGLAAIDTATMKVTAIYKRPLANLRFNPEQPDCTSNACRPQNPTVQTQIKGLSYSPPDVTGSQPKLLVLTQESNRPPGSEKAINVVWLQQWDVKTRATDGTAVQDWITRVSACSNHELPSGSPLAQYQVGLFQARLGSGIYIGCLVNGTGQVVRIVLDSTNLPSAEQAFVGPNGMIDAIPDEESDRMLLRVSNEEGEAWWVFDGLSSSYVGVIGTVLNSVQTAAGVDKANGRLYMMTTSSVAGNQRKRGGLLLSDIRRSPAPQALTYPEFSRVARGVIAVDSRGPDLPRNVWVYLDGTTKYLVLRDPTPITVDVPLLDRDSLTTDVEEEAGVTGINYGGSGLGYGLRTFAVGGVEGALPGGPDLAQYRLGRHVPRFVNSPCGPIDRELTIGSIREVGLTNNLSSAAAASAEIDPNTKTDIREPSARCYPRPTNVDDQRSDLFTQLKPSTITSQTISALNPLTPFARGLDQYYPEQYPRPLDHDVDEDEKDDRTDVDEVAGSSWPFTVVECSGDDADATTTTVQPLDRGDDETGPIPRAALTDEQREALPEQERDKVPNNLRNYAVTTDKLKSEVKCEQSKARVNAVSQGRAFLQEDVPGIGDITVGEVSSTATVYRDAERGLVSRSVAVARDIELGRQVRIDLAFTIAEAWAKGRPGTASTNFVRQVCGVKIEDQLQKFDAYAPGATLNPTVDPDRLDPDALDIQGLIDDIKRVPNEGPGEFSVDPEGGGPVDKGPESDLCGDPKLTATGSETPVIDAMNRVFGARARASAPQPDAEFRLGTPGGYLASIQKDRLEQISSRSVSNDPSPAVPAFEIIVFNDDPTLGRGRQIMQFAGVTASSTYGIYLLNPDELPDFPDLAIDLDGDGPVFDAGPQAAPVGPYVPIAGPPRQGPLTILYSSIQFLFRSPKDAVLAAAVWAILFAPVQLMSRRRALRALRWQ